MRQVGQIDGLESADLVVKAWIFWQGTGTPSIIASEGVSSLTDVGAGEQTVTFLTPFVSASAYAVVVATSWGGTSATHHFQGVESHAAGSIKTDMRNWSAGAASDPNHAYIAVVGEH